MLTTVRSQNFPKNRKMLLRKEILWAFQWELVLHAGYSTQNLEERRDVKTFHISSKLHSAYSLSSPILVHLPSVGLVKELCIIRTES